MDARRTARGLHKRLTHTRPTIRHSRIAELQRKHFLYLTVIPGLVTLASVLSLPFHQPSVEVVLMSVAMWLLTGTGVTVGYHRFFTHRAFKTSLSVATVLAVLGMMAAPGPLLPWVSTHRRHHAMSDEEGDPHSPNLLGNSFRNKLRGLLYAQFGWMRDHEFANPLYYARDLIREKRWRKIDRWYYVIVVAGIVLPTAFYGLLTLQWAGVADALFWAGFVRLFIVQAIISSVNSICHMFGNRAFDTPEKSTNNWLLAIPALGEGWHNNHHAFQTSAFLGLRWWEIDPGGIAIRLLAVTGLVWDVKRPAKEKIAAKKAGSSVIEKET